MRKSSCKRVKFGAYGLHKDCVLPKDKFKDLTERLPGLLQLSGLNSIVKQSTSLQEGLRTVPA